MVAVVGARKGVRRGRGSSGVIYVNGHPPVPEHIRKGVLRLMEELGRPTTAREAASALGYSHGYLVNMLRYMCRDGDLVVEVPAHYKEGMPTIYRLPAIIPADLPSEPQKTCCRCKRGLPISEFGRDRSQPGGRCSACRSCRNRTDRRQRRSASA
jgi:hypothetical protein